MLDTPLHFLTITGLAVEIHSKQISPVEVTSVMLERIERLDGLYKSYATVIADEAIDAAKIAEQEITDGRYRGLLHGVPIAVNLDFPDKLKW